MKNSNSKKQDSREKNGGKKNFFSWGDGKAENKKGGAEREAASGVKKIRRILILVIFAAAYIAAIIFANRGFEGYTTTDSTGIEYERAKVLEVLEVNLDTDDSMENYSVGEMELEIEILSGRYKGDVVQITDYLSAMFNVEVDEGDTITVRIDTSGEDEYSVSLYNYYRTVWIIVFVLIFAFALILLGGKQGARAFLGLIFTFISIVFLLLPLALKGIPSILVTIVIVGITTFVSFYLLGGWQPKTTGGALGCVCGICFAALFGAAAIGILHVTTYQMDEAEALMLARTDYGLKLRGLFLSSILITAQGAVMDIAMSVTSSMAELKSKRPDIGRKELFRSGMTVGRDASGTMANTLVLAVAGSSLNMMILIYSYQVTFTQLMNTDFVAIEVIRSIAGSMGILLAVPCAAAITAFLLTRSDPTPAPAKTGRKGSAGNPTKKGNSGRNSSGKKTKRA